MKNTGLSSETLNILASIFSRYPEIEEVILYGSRAKGNFTERSDIDLAAKGNISRYVISRILLELEDSNILNSIDLQSYNELKNRELIQHIDRVGIRVYSAI